MRVLHVGKFYAPSRGGIETVTQTMCRGLARAGVGVSVLVSPDHRGRGGVEERDGVRVERLASLGTLWSQPVVPGLAHAIRDAPCDLIHLHVPNPLAALAVLAQCGSRPLVISYHSGIRRQRLAAALHRLIERRLLRRADRVIVASASLREAFPSLREAEGRLEVVPYGIDPPAEGSCPGADEAPHATDEACAAPSGAAPPPTGRVARFRGRDGGPSIVFVGRLVEYKGLPVLVRAMREVDAVCHLAGRGPEEARLRRLASRLGVAERVRFHGEVSDDDREALLRACDLFVLPSTRPTEAFGIAQLEAMAAGVPVVSTDLATGVREVNAHGVTGLRVPPGDAPALARAMRTILEDPDLRARMGRAASERVRRRYRASRMVSGVLAIYGDLLGRGPLAGEDLEASAWVRP